MVIQTLFTHTNLTSNLSHNRVANPTIPRIHIRSNSFMIRIFQVTCPFTCCSFDEIGSSIIGAHVFNVNAFCQYMKNISSHEAPFYNIPISYNTRHCDFTDTKNYTRVRLILYLCQMVNFLNILIDCRIKNF